MISSMTLITCFVTLFVTLLLPIIAISVLSSRNKGEKMVSAWALGAAGFVVTQLIIRLPILTALQNQPWFMNFSENHGFLFVFTLALTAGLFELAGRFGVAKLMQKNLTFKRSLAAGLGHGGIEAMLLVGMTYINNLVYIVMINTGTFDSLIAEAVAAGNAAPQLDVLITQLEMIRSQLIDASPALFLLASLERVLTMTCHAGMSMIVCYGVATKKILPCLLICLGIHTMIDLTAGISLLSNTALSQTAVYIIVYLILAAVAALSLLIIRKFHSRWPQKEVTL